MYVDNSSVHHSHRDSGTKRGDNLGNRISVKLLVVLIVNVSNLDEWNEGKGQPLL